MSTTPPGDVAGQGALPQAHSSITILACDECGAVVGMLGKFALGCSRHPEGTYSVGGTYVAVDALLSERFVGRVLNAHIASTASGMHDAQREGIERAIQLELSDASSSRERAGS